MEGSRRGFFAAFAALLVANLLPLTAKYLPFTDLQGHMGLVGALARWNDPAARIPQYYTLNPRHFLPSMLFEKAGALATHLISVPLYTNLYMALACVIGPTLALAYLLRAYRRDVRLALLLFPVLYYRCVWFGFVDYLSSVPLILFGVGLLRRTLDEPRPLRFVGLLLVAILVVEAHFFGAGLFFGLCGLMLLCERPRRQTLGVLAALTPGALYLGNWLFGMRKRVGGGQILPRILHGQHHPIALAKQFYDWNIHGIQTRLCDLVMAGLALSFIGAVAFGIRMRARERQAGVQPSLLLFAVIALYVLLPFSIPMWWAINVRLVPLVWAFALLAIPAPRRPTPAWLLAPAVLAGLVWGGALTWDFHHYYNGVEMAGFDATIDAIPMGQRMLALWPDFEKEPHYTHFPMAHMGAQYIVRRGGTVAPMIDAEPDNVLIRVDRRPPFPPWGIARLFSYARFGAGWQYFLVKQPPPGSPPMRPPLGDAPPGAVTLVAQHGLWQAFRNNRAAP